MITPDRPADAAKVASHYDELDAVYRQIWGQHVHHGYWTTGDETPEQAADALVRLVEERLELEPDHRVCDIGCGYGLTASDLLDRHSISVEGFTLSPVQTAVARERNREQFLVHCCDWLSNGVESEIFDRAYAIESSEHMTDKAKFFAEASRVLRPGGLLVVCAWLEGEDARLWELRHLLMPICIEGRLPSMATRTEYEELAAAAGFAKLSYADISRNVSRTWSICLRRLVQSIFSNRQVRHLVLSSATRNRDFVLSLPRLIIALRTGAMRYGMFVWRKTA